MADQSDPGRQTDGRRVGARDVLLADDRVLVMSPLLATDHFSRDTQVAVVNIADPSSPQQLSSQRVTGRYLSARLHDGRVRRALAAAADPGFVAPNDTRTPDDAAEHNRAPWAKATGEDFLPTAVAANGRAAPLMRLSAIHRPAGFSGTDMVAVLIIDPKAQSRSSIRPG